MKIAGRCIIAVVIILGIIFSYFYAFGNFHAVVEERVYRSAQLSEKKLQKIIAKKKLKTIINLRGENEGKNWYAMEKKVAEDNDIQHYSFRFVAHRLPNCIQLDALIEALKAAPRPLLIHCKGGADRTGLASALALAIEKDSPLSKLKQQFSLIYGVIPFTGS
ncbi:MAG: tyrosine-protein phosphatase, partial [Desulfobacterales bacterium]|nr:tyrosine-protein phosphatase [Desulfobacterales bacterium]MDX2507962.1 tyrosine-protein phosphatase [Desulfobacterales bacterium]